MRSLPQPVDPDQSPAIWELTEIGSEPHPGTSFVSHACQTHWIGRTLPGETSESVFQAVRQALDGLPGLELGCVEMRQPCYTGKTLVVEDFIPGWKNGLNASWQARILYYPDFRQLVCR